MPQNIRVSPNAHNGTNCAIAFVYRQYRQSRNNSYVKLDCHIFDHRTDCRVAGVYRHSRNGDGDSSGIVRDFSRVVSGVVGSPSPGIDGWELKIQMKNNLFIITVMAVTAVVTGCKKSDTTENPVPGDTNLPPATNAADMSTNSSVTQQASEMASNAWAKTKEATTNAWEDVKDSLSSAWGYSYDQKDAFVADATNDLASLDQKIQEFSDKAATASDSAKADAQAKVQELRAKRAELDQKLDAVRNSTEANWNDVKTGFQASYQDAKDSVKQAWQWLKDKMSQ